MLFKELIEYYDKIEKVSSRLAMIDILADLFKKLDINEIAKTIYISRGILAPSFMNLKLGIADKIIEEAIILSVNIKKEVIENTYAKLGDLGLAAKQILEENTKTKQIIINSKEYSILDVYELMMKISSTVGHGSKSIKIKLLSNFFSLSTPSEAKYIIRFALGQLRLGFGDYTILEALSLVSTNNRKFKQELEQAYNICNDLGYIGELLFSGGVVAIKNIKVTLFKPIRPALAERAITTHQIVEKMGKIYAVEQKYDGFRCQIHKKNNTVKIFSRNLDETTHMFPDIIKEVINSIKEEEIIFEGEAIAFNEATHEFLPFQETIQRKRIYDIENKIKEIPLHLFAFDLLYLNKKSYLNIKYEKRQKKLKEILKNSEFISPAKRIISKSEEDLEKFFQESIEQGLEGIVAKSLNSNYITGARKFSWIKMKRSYRGELSDSLDLVIIGYFLGKGSRAVFGFGGLLCAVYNKKKDIFESVSKLGTGFSQEQMIEFKKLLNKIKLKTKPVRVNSIIKPDFWVEPKYIVVVRSDEITKSPTHTCGKENNIGYALRFPRLISKNETIRKDKSAEDATTTKEIIEMFNNQKYSKIEDN